MLANVVFCNSEESDFADKCSNAHRCLILAVFSILEAIFVRVGSLQ